VGDLGVADLAVLERYADPTALLKAGKARLTRLIATTSNGHLGDERAERWLAAARASVELYGSHPAASFVDLAAEVATEVRLLRAVEKELDAHAAERERCYRWVDGLELARSLPGLREVGAPALVATMGEAGRFSTGKRFRSYTGLAPRASETGETDRKGQPMSKAGPKLLRATLVRAADWARKQDPQLARIYHVQMTERGKDHLGALCVVAANLAERAWAVMDRGMPYVVCDTDGRPVTPKEVKAIIAERFTVTEEARKRHRSRKQAGKAPQKVLAGHSKLSARGASERGDPPHGSSFGHQSRLVKEPA
jgi:hypothetical protein